MAFEFIERMAAEIETPTGGGDPVLMIHGLGGSANSWTPLMPAFQRFETLRFDLPGSGRSHRVTGPLSIERFVQAALRVLASAGRERAHVVGHSLGTIVATHLAAHAPKAVRSLVLFGPLLAPPDSAKSAIRARGEKAAKEGVAGMHDIAETLLQGVISAETRAKRRAAVAFVRESLMGQDPDGYARSCFALADATPTDTARIACPTLLVTGDDDIVAPPQTVRAMGEKIAGAQVEVLRGCGHWTPVEKPDECMDLLQRFYQRRTA